MPQIELDIGAQLIASLESLAAAMARQEARRQRIAQAIRQVPLTANSPNPAGVIDSPETLRVHDGYFWSVRRLTLSGFTAGSAVVYRNALNGDVLVPFSSAATATFGRGEMLLNPGDRMVIQFTGLTGTPQLNGAADMLEMALFADYIL